MNEIEKSEDVYIYGVRMAMLIKQLKWEVKYLRWKCEALEKRYAKVGR